MTLPTRCLVAVLFACSLLKAQAVLPFMIDNHFIPDDSALINPVLTYHDTSSLFVSSGYQVGDTVPDFNLPDTNYVNVRLSDILNEGKPVVLVAVSYSCPPSRMSMQYVLPSIVGQFGTDVNFILVYVVEAHPVFPDWSPYYDTVNTTQENINDSILIRQETQYYQRKQYTLLANSRYHPQATFVMDDLNNDYWHHFGPAPNNAYLLKPSGEVFKKYGWFAYNQHVIIHDLEQLLSMLGTTEQTEGAFHLYPVPATTDLTIQTDFQGEWTLELLDESGRLIKHIEKITAVSYTLDTSALAKGAYIISASDGKTTFHTRIIAGY